MLVFVASLFIINALATGEAVVDASGDAVDTGSSTGDSTVAIRLEIIVNGDVSTTGFSWSYQISHPKIGGKIYWLTTPAESVSGLTADDVMSGASTLGEGCHGSESQEDENEHTVTVQCSLQPGGRYKLWVTVDDDGNGLNKLLITPFGQELRVSGCSDDGDCAGGTYCYRPGQADSTCVLNGSVGSGAPDSTATGSTDSTTTGSTDGSTDAGTGSGSSGGSTTVIDYNPCYGRKCGMICNNCQLGVMCPDVVNRCNAIGQCVSDSFTCPDTNPAPRHPLTRVQCTQQSQATCYGLAADKTAEQDGVCGWSAQLRRCVVVAIGEEGKEGNTCMMHRTIAACNGATAMPGQLPNAILPMAEEGVDTVCAWNPFTNTCKDGQLESEAGDGMGFGMATFDVCNIGKTPANCPMPYCQWLHNSCVPGAGVAELQKTHNAQEEKYSTSLLAGISAGAFFFGLVGTFVAARKCNKSSKYAEPLSMGRV